MAKKGLLKNLCDFQKQKMKKNSKIKNTMPIRLYLTNEFKV